MLLARTLEIVETGVRLLLLLLCARAPIVERIRLPAAVAASAGGGSLAKWTRLLLWLWLRA